MFFRIDDEGGLSEPRPDEPGERATAHRVHEETLETWLGLHLQAITGTPMELVRLAPPMSPVEDIVAFDRAGRMHLFELKSGPITKRVAGQLEHYLLGRIWADPSSFRAHRVREGRDFLQPGRLDNRLSGRSVVSGPCDWAMPRS